MARQARPANVREVVLEKNKHKHRKSVRQGGEMPILLEYALLAILGSAPPTARRATPATPLTMTADCVGQPSGGAAGDSCSSGGIGLIAQDTGGDKASKTKSGTGKKPVKHLES